MLVRVGGERDGGAAGHRARRRARASCACAVGYATRMSAKPSLGEVARLQRREGHDAAHRGAAARRRWRRSSATQRTDLDATRRVLPPRRAAATIASTLRSSASRSTAASGSGSPAERLAVAAVAVGRLGGSLSRTDRTASAGAGTRGCPLRSPARKQRYSCFGGSVWKTTSCPSSMPSAGCCVTTAVTFARRAGQVAPPRGGRSRAAPTSGRSGPTRREAGDLRGRVVELRAGEVEAEREARARRRWAA